MDIILSISLLASGRRGSLERCLDSLKPLLVKVPCELIIVLTGTDEGAKKIAEKYTPQVIPFQWCGDFSAARNAGLKEARGEWFLYLDDDEWFEDAEEICDFFLSGEYRDYGCAHYIQRSYQDWDGTKYSDFSAFRMVRRFPGTRFENPIHEELTPRKGPCRYFQSCVHHYGYVKDEPGREGNRKTARNISLLVRAVQEQPDFVKNYLQLTKEYDLEGDWKTAEAYCREGRSRCQGAADPSSKGWLQAYLSHLLCKKPGKHPAIAEIEAIIETEHPSELVLLILYQQLVHLYKGEKEPEKAVRCGIRFERLLDDMDRNADLWEKQGYGEFDENYVKNPERLYGVIADCTACALELKAWDQALYFLELFPWEEEDILCRYYPVFEEWRAKYGSDFTAIASRISGPLDEADPVYLLFIKALELLKSGKRSDGECLYIRCMGRSEDACLQQILLREALQNRIDVSELAARMDLHTWDAGAGKAVKGIPYPLTGTLMEHAEKLMENDLLHGLCLKKHVIKLKLLKGFFMWEELTGALESYCQCILTFYKAQYKNEMFGEGACALLPGECRFAITALDALGQLESGQPAEAVRLFRRCVKIDPSMTGTIKELLRQAVRQINDPALHAGSEFCQLAGQMKGTLAALLDTGQTDQAAGILDHLLPLMPEDVELVRMRQELIRRTKP